MATGVVLDTNIFVAAGFNPRTHAARILVAVRAGERTLVWNEAARAEVLHILGKIRPLASWDVAPLFRAEAEFRSAADPAG